MSLVIAALALVLSPLPSWAGGGWYLLVPPSAMWNVDSAYESSSTCDRARVGVFKRRLYLKRLELAEQGKLPPAGAGSAELDPVERGEILLALMNLETRCAPNAGRWELLVEERTSSHQVDTGRPVREWTQIAAFDTAEACERERAARIKKGEAWTADYAKALERTGADEDKRRPLTRLLESADRMVTTYQLGGCFATDDPRLK
jgi:hypothetical protein